MTLPAPIISLEAYRALILAREQEHAESVCGVARFGGLRVAAGKVILSTSLDDEALVLTPAAARLLSLHLMAFADEAEGSEF